MRGLKITALILGALVLIPSGAHLLELPHKLAMDRGAYFSAQQLYMGWALSAVPIVATIVMDILLWRRLRRDERARGAPALASALLIAGGLGIFFVWIYPANRVTQNWTVIPGDWADLRVRWEYAHAVIAVLTLAAFVCVASCCTSARRDDRQRWSGV
jgi:cytochrome bd-type quinol oxidase subunit 2